MLVASAGASGEMLAHSLGQLNLFSRCVTTVYGIRRLAVQAIRVSLLLVTHLISCFCQFN